MGENETEIKKDYTVYLYPSVRDMIDAHLKIADKRSRSDFIEAAIRFYCGVIDTEQNKSFLGDEIISQVKAITDELSGTLLAKLRSMDISMSEIAMILAASNSDMTNDEIELCRKEAVRYVAENARAKSFFIALKEERDAD